MASLRPSYIMAQSAYEPRWAGRPIPTLEDSYNSLMANSARIVQLVDRHMAIGHLLETPWEEARTLRDRTTNDEFLFDCLWRSEPDAKKFENLREWVAVVKTDARSKIKALDLFMRLRERQRQRTEPHYPKPCNPPSEIPVTCQRYNSVIVNDAMGKLTEQAMPNIHGEDGAYVPLRNRPACSMDLEPGKQIRRIHTAQPNRQQTAYQPT